MHKYFDWQLIESLPLSALGELLSFAYKEEERKAKNELAKQLLPLWLARYAADIANGDKPAMSFSEFLNTTIQVDKEQENSPARKHLKERSLKEIEAEFAPIIAADRKRGG